MLLTQGSREGPGPSIGLLLPITSSSPPGPYLESLLLYKTLYVISLYFPGSSPAPHPSLPCPLGDNLLG